MKEHVASDFAGDKVSVLEIIQRHSSILYAKHSPFCRFLMLCRVRNLDSFRMPKG